MVVRRGAWGFEIGFVFSSEGSSVESQEIGFVFSGGRICRSSLVARGGSLVQIGFVCVWFAGLGGGAAFCNSLLEIGLHSFGQSANCLCLGLFSRSLTRGSFS